MRTWKLAVLVLMLGGQAASASDADVAARFGVLGNWAFDCSKPPAGDNAYQSFALSSDGAITRTLNMGDGNAFNGTTGVHDLKAVSADKWSATFVRASDGYTTTTTALQSGNRNRGWQSAMSDGTVFIKDGVFVKSGKPTPWFEKCGK